jgi:hypothetical protein
VNTRAPFFPDAGGDRNISAGSRHGNDRQHLLNVFDGRTALPFCLQLVEGGTRHAHTQHSLCLDRLRLDFNGSVGKLASTLSHIRGGINSIDASAGEMRTAVDALAKRTEQQAASLEETSVALQEISSIGCKKPLTALPRRRGWPTTLNPTRTSPVS